MNGALRFWLLPLLLWISTAYANEIRTDLHIFWSKQCPHCEKALDFLAPLPQSYPGLQIHRHEISEDPISRQLLIDLAHQRQLRNVGVPLMVLGDEIHVGYRDDASTGQMLKSRIEACRANHCKTRLKPISPIVQPASKSTQTSAELNPRHLSLPLLTITLAAADGFNPCAMWVLVFLIGLLLSMRSRARRWCLGCTFIAASALVYYLIMTAWLNTLLLIGAASWLRLGIALVALIAGAWSIKSFLQKEQVCTVTAAPARRAVLARLRQLALSASLPLALIGISLLAFVVNMVELLCSAGIPAVYTQYLALQPLPDWQRQAYLLLYLLIFMADDLLIFIGTMLTLDITGLGARYSRWSKLLGGLVLLVIGTLMLLKPEWL